MQISTPTSCPKVQEVESCNEDISKDLKENRTEYSIAVRDFNSKIDTAYENDIFTKNQINHVLSKELQVIQRFIQTKQRTKQ